MATHAIGGFGACAFNSTQIGDSVSTKTAVAFHARTILMLVVMAAITACASAAPEYGGRWKSVNRYADTPQEIPLYQAYAFYPSPMDGTLKTMLERTSEAVEHLTDAIRLPPFLVEGRLTDEPESSGDD